jgi:hypothetical protein
MNAVKASDANNTVENENSTTVQITTLPDGVIERRYSNGTVTHDLFITAQVRNLISAR